MSVIDTTKAGAVRQPSGVVQLARYAYLLSIVLFMGGIVLQVFLAGAALLVDPGYLIQHRSFAHALHLVTYMIPIIGLLARLPWRLFLLSWLPLVLLMLQYVFVHAVPGLGLPMPLRALHAVNALVLFWLMLHLAGSAWRLVRAS